MPSALDSNGFQLVVADSNDIRVLIWNSIPTTNFTPAAAVLGQSDFTHNAYNDDNQNGTPDSTPSARTLRYPSGVYIYGTELFVTDEEPLSDFLVVVRY